MTGSKDPDTNPEGADEPDFDQRWEEIVSSLDFPDLSDLPSPVDPSNTYEQVAADFLDLDAHEDDDDPATVATISSRASGPRDWVPKEDDEDDSFDEDLVTLTPLEDEAPTAPLTRALWLGSAVSFALAALSAFGVFGNTTIVLAAGALGFILAAIAAFNSAPRAEDVDPFDDGARL
ncbi:MAG: hypothetical protein Q3979_06630 [Actinomycetaceae bacterium]|nr:hypothetical protein [Actinomycetaceae bacterium]